MPAVAKARPDAVRAPDAPAADGRQHAAQEQADELEARSDGPVARFPPEKAAPQGWGAEYCEPGRRVGSRLVTAEARRETAVKTPDWECCAPLTVVDGWSPAGEVRSAGYAPAGYFAVNVPRSAVCALFVDCSRADAEHSAGRGPVRYCSSVRLPWARLAGLPALPGDRLVLQL